jgi:TonB-linked SusC/RagA family outer membrane protein
MKRFTVLLAFFVFLGFQALMAQSVQISGNVTSAEDGGPLPGVSVVVKGTTIGTITDAKGDYTLSVPQSATAVVFSFIGYEDNEVAVSGQTTINVVMELSSTELDEVVVTALGISRDKKSLGYASTSVSGDEIADSRVDNPMLALQGRVTGIDIESAPGPGATKNVIIRGASSFGANQPLYVVDGVPFINQQNRAGDNLNFGVDFGSGINAINPNDIENLTVLKGAAATALYGSRAANGVVLITTKSGKNTNGKMKVDYSGSFSLSRIGRIPERQDQFGQGWSGYHALDENGNWGSKYTGEDRVYGFVIDNSQMIKPYSFVESRVRDFYDYGQSYNNSLSLSGGNETTNYYMSVSSNNVDGVYPGAVDVYDRYTISTRGEHQWDKLKISSSVNYANETNIGVPSGQGNTVFRSLWEIAEDYSVVDMKDYNNKFWNMDNYFTPYGVNPYWSLANNGSNQKKNKVFGKIQLDYSLTDNLRAMYRFGGDYENTLSEAWIAKIKFTPGAPSFNGQTEDPGSYNLQARDRYETNHEAFLNYSYSFSNFDFNALIGINANERGYKRIGGNVSPLDVDGYYNLSNGTSPATSTMSISKRRLLGIFGTVNLAYDNLLFLNLTARRDKSSTLPEDNNSYYYPGATLSFAVSELLKKGGMAPAALDFAKIRVAYGKTGNDAGPYQIFPTYVQSYANNPGFPNVDDLLFPFNGINAWAVSNQLGNLDLKPEFTYEFETGIEMYFYKNRLGLELSYYNKLTEGLIAVQPLDPSSGFTNIVNNIGDVSNKGIEALISISPVRTSNFDWTFNVNYSQNKNNVEKLAEGEVFLGGFGGVGIVAVEGKELGMFKTQIAQVVMIDGVEHPVVDGVGMPISTPDEVVTDKSINEKFRAGFTNTFTYKGLSLSATVDLRYGGYIYSYQKDYMGWTGSGPETVYNDRNPFVIPNSVKEILEGGVVTGYEENTVPVATQNLHTFYSNGGFERNDNFIIDRSYLKLREVRLGYSFPSSLASKLKVASLKASLVAGNILLWTPVENQYIDPETTTFGNDISAKFGEFGGGPTNQLYTVGLSVTF